MPDAAAPREPVQELKSLFVILTQALVDDPAAVYVEITQEQNGTTTVLEVSPSDFGKVIGKQGRTARSLRMILGAVSMKHNQRFSLSIVDRNHLT